MNNAKLNLIFLGTGTSQGVPPIGCDSPVCLSSDPKDQRLRSSVVIQKSGRNYLIDCGPDFRQQYLRQGLTTLEAILITHEHNDHVSGLDDIRPIIFKAKRKMPIYTCQRVANELKVRFAYAFQANPYPGVPGLDLQPIDNEEFWINDLKVRPFAVHHGGLEIHGFMFDDRLVYMTDVSEIPEESKAIIRDREVVVCSALRKRPAHFSHLTLDQAKNLMNELNPKTAYYTHISHLMGFHERTQSELPINHFLAYDGLVVSI